MFQAVNALGTVYDIFSGLEDTLTIVLNGGCGPYLQVTHATLAFSATQGGANPPTQLLTVNSVKGALLDWSYQTASDTGWLSTLGFQGGSLPSTISVSANIGGLLAGSYSGSIKFSPGSLNVPVSLTINPQPVLTITTAGTGSGTVSPPSPAGTRCGSNCWIYPPGAVVTLTAIPAAGSTFTGWSGGGCSGNGSCVVTMNSSVSVTATFSLVPPPQQYTLTITTSPGTGSGTVSPPSPAGTRCGSNCWIYPPGAVVTLTAIPAAGSITNWSVDGCSGNVCVVTMNSNLSVTAAFNLPYTYTGAYQTTVTTSTDVASGCLPSPWVSQGVGTQSAQLVAGTPVEGPGSFSGSLTLGSGTVTTTTPALTCTTDGITTTIPGSTTTTDVPGGTASFSGTSDGRLVFVSQMTQSSMCVGAATCSVSGTVSLLAGRVYITVNVSASYPSTGSVTTGSMTLNLTEK